MDKTARNRLPGDAVWVTPTATDYSGFSNVNKESIISVPPHMYGNGNEVFSSFKNGLIILDQVKLYQHVDWVVVTPFGPPTNKTVRDMHSAYVQVANHNRNNLDVFRRLR